MSDDLHNIDDLFKRGLEEHRELPSPRVWDSIDKSLDKKKVVSISKKYNKLKWAVAVLFLFSVGMASYILHIHIKDKELIKNNNVIKISKSKKSGMNNNLKDPVNTVTTNNTEIEKARINTKLKNQEKNNNSLITGAGTANKPGEKNAAIDISRENKHLADNIQRDMWPFERKPNGRINNKQNQEQLLLKNHLAVNMQENPAGASPADNIHENTTGSIVTNDDKMIYTNKEPGEKSNEHFGSLKKNYFSRIPTITGLKDMAQILAVNRAPKIYQVSVDIPAVSNGNNNIPIKGRRAGPFRQRIIKNSSLPLSATIFFSPDVVSTNVRNDHPLFREEDRHEIEKNEKIKFASTLGVLIDYTTGKNWKIESGITFSTRFINIDPKTIYARPDNNGHINYRFNCSAGYSFVTLKSSGLPPVSGDSINALTSKNILRYIGVPLVIKYTVGQGRFTITPGVGITANFLTKGKIETIVPTTTGNEKVTSNAIQGLKHAYFNGLVSAGAQYKLSKAFELTFIPTVCFALSSINKDAPVKTYLNSVGFATGVLIKLY